MKLIISKSKWAIWDDALEALLQQVMASGFDVTDIWLDSLSESPAGIVNRRAAGSLRLTAQILI